MQAASALSSLAMSTNSVDIKPNWEFNVVLFGDFFRVGVFASPPACSQLSRRVKLTVDIYNQSYNRREFDGGLQMGHHVSVRFC